MNAGCFVNTSRIHPNKLVVEASRLKIHATNENAVGIMLGVVTECFVVKDGSGGNPQSPSTIHKVSIVPFAQEMRRDTSLWGQLFDFHVVSGPVSAVGITFSTRSKGSGSRCKSPLGHNLAML